MRHVEFEGSGYCLIISVLLGVPKPQRPHLYKQLSTANLCKISSYKEDQLSAMLAEQEVVDQC